MGISVLMVLILILIVVALVLIWPLFLKLSRGHVVEEKLSRSDGVALLIYWVAVCLLVIGVVMTFIGR